MIIEEALFQIIIGVGVTALVSGIGYIIHLTRKVLTTVEMHNRIFFGEEGVDTWNGLIAMIMDNNKLLADQNVKMDENRRAIIKIIECLEEHELIDSNSPLYQLAIRSNL